MMHFYSRQKLESSVKSLTSLPSPSSLSYFWNFGSLLGLCLGLQLITGIFLAMHYVSDVSQAFDLISHIMRDVNQGWFLRIAHANGASAFFFCLYLHISRGIFYSSFLFSSTWLVGGLLFVMVMAVAFLGYVLPWGQMSFWGATVITNLFSAIPFLGEDIVFWLWGGFSVSQATLNRFFVFHFLFPFVLVALAFVHLVFLHESGSSNPLGLTMGADKVAFHPLFTAKDFLGAVMFLTVFFFLVLAQPWLLGDPENFNAANPLVTPLHIQPEWYFLFAYAILRSIPNKVGGVLGLAAAVLVIFILPLTHRPVVSSKKFNPLSVFMFWSLVVVFFLLTWLGACPVEPPFYVLGQWVSCLYFAIYGIEWGVSRFWESAIFSKF